MKIKLVDKESNFLHLELIGLFDISKAIENVYELITNSYHDENYLIVEINSSCFDEPFLTPEIREAHATELSDFINSFDKKKNWKIALLYHDTSAKSFLQSILVNTAGNISHVHIFDDAKEARNWVLKD